MIDIERAGRDIDKRLARLEKALQEKALKYGLSRAAVPVKGAMKRNAPRRTGDMARAVGSRVLGKKDQGKIELIMSNRHRDPISIQDGQWVVLIGPIRKNSRGYSQAFKGALTEFGVDPHVIRPRKGNKRHALRLLGGRWVREVRHPGFKGRYWMAKSGNETTSEVQTAFYQGLSRYLDKLA